MTRGEESGILFASKTEKPCDGGHHLGCRLRWLFLFSGSDPGSDRRNKDVREAAGQTVADYLASSGFNAARVVVELNEAIVPKARYADTVLRDGDQVEVVCFMGGG